LERLCDYAACIIFVSLNITKIRTTLVLVSHPTGIAFLKTGFYSVRKARMQAMHLR